MEAVSISELQGAFPNFRGADGMCRSRVYELKIVILLWVNIRVAWFKRVGYSATMESGLNYRLRRIESARFHSIMACLELSLT